MSRPPIQSSIHDRRELRYAVGREASSSKRSRSAILIGILLCASSLNSGCRTETRVAQASQALADKITREESSPPVAVRPGVEAEESRVYLDASLSMSGFVSAGNRSRFDEVLDSIGDHMPGCLLFKFGQPGETPPPNPAQLTNPRSLRGRVT